MRYLNKRIVITYLLIVAVQSLSASAIANDTLVPPLFDTERVAWRRLIFKANGVLGKVTSDISLKALPVDSASDLLIVDPAGEAFQPSGKPLILLSVHSNIDPLFGSNEILTTQSWLDPNGAGVLQRVRLRRGDENWQKSYRFSQNGAFRLRKKPRDAREANLPIDQWSKIRKHFYPYGNKAAQCTQILDPASLMCIASAIDLAPNSKPLNLCVYNKKQLHRVKIYAGDSQPMQVDYILKSADTQFQTRKKTVATKITFQPLPLAPEDIEPEAFSFLGLKGDFEIFVDNASRIPIQISGRIAVLGKIDIILQEVEVVQTER